MAVTSKDVTAFFVEQLSSTVPRFEKSIQSNSSETFLGSCKLGSVMARRFSSCGIRFRAQEQLGQLFYTTAPTSSQFLVAFPSQTDPTTDDSLRSN